MLNSEPISMLKQNYFYKVNPFWLDVTLFNMWGPAAQRFYHTGMLIKKRKSLKKPVAPPEMF